MLRAQLARTIVVSLLLASAGCGGREATVLFVTVTARPGVSGTVALEATFANGGEKRVTRFSQAGRPITLPASFVVHADGRSGLATVDIKALDSSERLVGEGSTTAVLMPDERVDCVVALDPSDFQVNAIHQDDQSFNAETSGRQAGGSTSGNSVIVWQEACPPAQQCPIWFRLFDQNGQPRQNASTGNTTEGKVSASGDGYDMPAVAMQPQGTARDYFVVAFRRHRSSGVPEVNCRAFTPGGNPDAAGAGGTEQLLSSAGANNPAAPSIAAWVGDSASGYVVVWQQEDGTKANWQVMGRLLDDHGMVSGQSFVVTSFSRSGTTRPSPVVTAGPKGAFLVAWREGGSIKARAYAPPDPSAVAKGAAFDVAQAPTGKVEELTAAPLLYGFALIWSDRMTSGRDTSGTSIRLRRFDITGKPREDEFTLNTTFPGDQRQPTAAMRQDGSLLVAWTDAGGTTSNIRARKVLSNGLPVGPDYIVNTTTADMQSQPALASLGRDGFLLAFVDASKSGPDASGTGIRGRLLFPEYAPRDGQVGALCDSSAPCGSGLACYMVQTGQRCVAECQGSGAACEHGGRCTLPTLPASTTQWCCFYP